MLQKNDTNILLSVPLPVTVTRYMLEDGAMFRTIAGLIAAEGTRQRRFYVFYC